VDFRTHFETTPQGQGASVRSGAKSLLREVVETILLTAVIFYAVNFTTGRFRIDGDSMEPTMHDGQYVIISKLSYRLNEPERGDVIVFRFPRSPERDFIKRIIGLPGDTIEIRDQMVMVNGVPLHEDYISSAPSYENTWQVEPGQYFVLGDNRNNSSDSHTWGLLPAENIIGKAWVTYWPPQDWGLAPHEDPAVAAP